MLVTLVVLWVVVIPALTLAGTYVLAGVRAGRSRAHGERVSGLTARSIDVAASHPRRTRTRSHAGRTRGHALIPR
jgi:hypothetical protein